MVWSQMRRDILSNCVHWHRLIQLRMIYCIFFFAAYDEVEAHMFAPPLPSSLTNNQHWGSCFSLIKAAAPRQTQLSTRAHQVGDNHENMFRLPDV